MNLFIFGWNLPKEQHAKALAELRHMHGVYPQLDFTSVWNYSSPCGAVFLASMHTADEAAAPRRYVVRSANEIVLYAGLPVCVSGAFEAHRAEALATHWAALTDDLDGQYAVLRATSEPACVELQTDFLGMEQVFYYGQRDRWLVSNSVQLIERINEPMALDPLGVSLFLSIGWAGADRTLRRDAKVIPGGQQWVWRKGDNEPSKRSYFAPSRLASLRPQRLTPRYVERLAEDLMALCRSGSHSFGTITCPLTAGRDSRLLAALLNRAELPAEYYTSGAPSSADVKIASQIAKAFGLDHRIHHIDTADVVREWDALAWKYVRRNDGMSSLFQIADSMRMTPQITRLKLSLHGIGGEIGRGFYGNPRLFLGRHDVAAVQVHMIERLVKNHGGLLRAEVTALVREYLKSFATGCVDAGFRPIDVPDVFYTYQRVGRWGGNNARRAMPVSDLFSPFCSRSFVEAAFSLSAWQRYTEPLHYRLLEFLSPELHRLPFEKEGWRSQHPITNVLLKYGIREMRQIRDRLSAQVRRMRIRSKSRTVSSGSSLGLDHSSWLEAKREQIREVCLDQNSQSLWEFIDRPTFERLMSSSTRLAERQSYRGFLYQVFTLFYNEADRQSWLSTSPR